MPTRQMRLAPAAPDDVSSALAALRTEVGLPAMFPKDVLEEAGAAAERDFSTGRADRRDVELVTIDPPGSKDLDQAVHVRQSGEGYVVRYAIADLGAFVTPGGALDAEVRRRGMTVYGPDARTPLHPAVLSEGAASLLPEEDRPAVLWTVALDSRGAITGASLERALVRSRERLTYAEVQSALDAGTASESLQLLADVGRLRQSLEAARGGVSLQVPEQEVERREDGTYSLSFRRNLPVEEWNAQISLLTGIVAARIMRDAGVGLLRTLPEADPRDLARLRRTARALRIEWPDDVPYARLVPTLESRIPEHAAFLNEATTLFRGAGYVAFGMPGSDGVAVPPPEHTRHAAIAADYAHVTAPLRRLVDRYATEICLAVSAGTSVPAWVLAAMTDLPSVMADTGRRASSFDRECVNIVEASVLADRLGEEFDGVVVDIEDPAKEPQRGQVVLRDPAVRGRLEGRLLPLGDEVRVTLTEADVSDRRVLFTLPGGRAAGTVAGRPAVAERAAAERAAAERVADQRAAPERPAPAAARPAPESRALRQSGPRAPASAGRRGATPAPFAVPVDGPVPAHGAVVPLQPGPEPTPGPRSERRRGSGPASGSAGVAPVVGPELAPRQPPQSRRASGIRPASSPPQTVRPGQDLGPGVSVPSAAPRHQGYDVGYPPARRPVRPQVRDEMPLSEPWPLNGSTGGPLSRPVPTVGAGALPDVPYVAEHPVSSLELPVVVAADLLAVEGRAPDVYRR